MFGLALMNFRWRAADLRATWKKRPHHVDLADSRSSSDRPGTHWRREDMTMRFMIELREVEAALQGR
jgi:hypothetical protein